MNRRKGFSLIELIIVVAIVLIIAAIALPKFGFQLGVTDDEFAYLMAQENIKMAANIGHQYNTCNGYAYNTGFVGLKNNVQVSGAICKAYNQEMTIKYFVPTFNGKNPAERPF